jgi:hypothetical protein
VPDPPARQPFNNTYSTASGFTQPNPDHVAPPAFHPAERQPASPTAHFQYPAAPIPTSFPSDTGEAAVIEGPRSPPRQLNIAGSTWHLAGAAKASDDVAWIDDLGIERDDLVDAVKAGLRQGGYPVYRDSIDNDLSTGVLAVNVWETPAAAYVVAVHQRGSHVTRLDLTRKFPTPQQLQFYYPQSTPGGRHAAGASGPSSSSGFPGSGGAVVVEGRPSTAPGMPTLLDLAAPTTYWATTAGRLLQEAVTWVDDLLPKTEHELAAAVKATLRQGGYPVYRDSTRMDVYAGRFAVSVGGQTSPAAQYDVVVHLHGAHVGCLESRRHVPPEVKFYYPQSAPGGGHAAGASGPSSSSGMPAQSLAWQHDPTQHTLAAPLYGIPEEAGLHASPTPFFQYPSSPSSMSFPGNTGGAVGFDGLPSAVPLPPHLCVSGRFLQLNPTSAQAVDEETIACIDHLGIELADFATAVKSQLRQGDFPVYSDDNYRAGVLRVTVRDQESAIVVVHWQGSSFTKLEVAEAAPGKGPKYYYPLQSTSGGGHAAGGSGPSSSGMPAQSPGGSISRYNIALSAKNMGLVKDFRERHAEIATLDPARLGTFLRFLQHSKTEWEDFVKLDEQERDALLEEAKDNGLLEKRVGKTAVNRAILLRIGLPVEEVAGSSRGMPAQFRSIDRNHIVLSEKNKKLVQEFRSHTTNEGHPGAFGTFLRFLQLENIEWDDFVQSSKERRDALLRSADKVGLLARKVGRQAVEQACERRIGLPVEEAAGSASDSDADA